MTDDVTQGVYHRVHIHEKNGRRFSVRIRSDQHGYTGRLVEHLSDGATVAASFNYPPRWEIDPRSFYKNRRVLRAELVKRINEELDEQSVIRVDAAADKDVLDAYIRANLIGYPDGFLGVVEDDLSDWIDVKPHWYGAQR
ncbi:hypothetical protein [Burkholderia gladioli]|uniref:hypothetical protein n=1 Tax=Burkholderia gladioli TaxID=28095 RepID=UPI0016403340|nr:hypothetical protein [Burkholderia gladioli]